MAALALGCVDLGLHPAQAAPGELSSPEAETLSSDRPTPQARRSQRGPLGETLDEQVLEGDGPAWLTPSLRRLLEGVGGVMALLSGVPLLLTSLFLMPMFMDMYASFGGELPAFTRLVFTPGLALVAGLVPLVCAGLSFGGVLPRRLRLPTLAFAVCWGLALEAAVIVALYLPLLGLADAITAD